MMPMLSHSNSLIDEDPGIMSEAETSATGFRRGSKQRSSLPVVRTPSKTLERPLGLVFLQYRHETKRAILPNEITTLDTVRALFVRSFSRQLSMEYFDSHNVRIYIHDSNQDMFYELEDLRDIRDRSILRLFEPDELKHPMNFHSALPISLSQLSFFDDVNNDDADQPLDLDNPRLMPGSPLSSGTWDDLSYFSEPEFDSDYRPQHVHKAKNRATKPIGLTNGRQASLSSSAPTHGSMASLIQPPIISGNVQGRGALHRSYSISAEQTPSPPRIDRNAVVSPVKLGRDYITSISCDQPRRWEEDGGTEVITGFFPCSQQALPPQVPPRPPERSFHNYGTSPSVKPTYVTPSSSLTYGSNPVSGLNRSPVFGNGFNDIRPPSSTLFQNNPGDPPLVDEQTRKRMEQVERQLASLTGLVQTALTGAVGVHVTLPDTVPDSSSLNSVLPLSSEGELGLARHLTAKTPRLGKSSKEKCVSFEKSVSFCDDPIDYEGKHSPQPTESKPAKPAIKSSTLPRASSQVSVYKGDSGWIGSMETYTQLRLLQKNARDLRSEMRSLRRLSQAQLSAVKEAVKDTIQIMKKTFLVNSDIITSALSEGEPSDIETSLRNVHRQEDNYQKEMKQLEKDLSELEASVENLRSHVINKKTRVSMADVEQLAALLSRSSKSVDLLKAQFPALEESIKGVLTYQIDRQADETRFLAEAPNKLENTIGRCKKLTSTLVTLRRLASVQEQRQPNIPDKPSISKSAATYSTSVTGESSTNVNRNSNSQQGSSWYEAAQQSDAFTASLELQPTNRAVVNDSSAAATTTAAVTTSRNSSRSSNQCVIGQSQRTESRSPNALDALLDELKHYSETNRPGLETAAQSKAAGSGPRLQPISLEPPKSTLSTSVPYAESSVDSIVSHCDIATNATSSRRRAPPPPPPRTSSRSPLASPLRAPRSLQSRPLPSLPSTTAESNHFAMPLVMKVAPLLSPQSTMLSQRQRCNSSLTSDEPKVPAVTETGSKINTGNNQLLAYSTQSNSQRIAASSISQVDGLLRAASTTPVTSFFGSRRASYTEANIPAVVAGVGCGVPLTPPVPPKRDTLESRHQELLKTQRQLQEQYDRLQKLHGVQFVPGAVALPTIQSSPLANEVMIPHHQTNVQTTGSCSDNRNAHSENLVDAETNQETNTATGNGLSKNMNHPVDSVEFNDQQSTSSTTSSIKTDVDCEKGRDLLFISLLLDNTHGTDIL